MNTNYVIHLFIILIAGFSLLAFSMCEDFQDLTGEIHDDHTAELLTPLPGTEFDNGCSDKSDAIQWDFDWSDVPGAVRYQLCILHEGSQYLLVDAIVTVSEYSYRAAGAYITDGNRSNWSWMVRAGTPFAWETWSEIHYFDVEPLDTDCRRINAER
ncbi:MAG: hypothetical protein JW881_06250 [Spirochaetales bacterium]|nr:hypothetical protein [Spirochaetales bacterium]